MEKISAGDIDAVRSDALMKQSESWVERAKSITVSDQATYDQAAELVKAIAGLKQQVVDHHKDPKEKARAAWQSIRDAEARMLEPLKTADDLIRGKLGAFLREQERIRREEEQRRLDEARKREEDLRVATAIEAEKVGANEAEVEEILTKSEPVTIEKTPETFQKAKGVGGRKTWKWKLVDESKIPRDYLMINEKAINAIVKSLGAKTNIPGIKVFEDFSVSVRRK